MKLCRYGKAGYEKPGVIDGEGRLRDLSKVIDNLGPNEISPRGLKMLTRLKPETLPPVNGSPRFGVPYVGIGKFIVKSRSNVFSFRRCVATNRADRGVAALPPAPVLRSASRVHRARHRWSAPPGGL